MTAQRQQLQQLVNPLILVSASFPHVMPTCWDSLLCGTLVVSFFPSLGGSHVVDPLPPTPQAGLHTVPSCCH